MAPWPLGLRSQCPFVPPQRYTREEQVQSISATVAPQRAGIQCSVAERVAVYAIGRSIVGDRAIRWVLRSLTSDTVLR